MGILFGDPRDPNNGSDVYSNMRDERNRHDRVDRLAVRRVGGADGGNLVDNDKRCRTSRSRISARGLPCVLYVRGGVGYIYGRDGGNPPSFFVSEIKGYKYRPYTKKPRKSTI